MAKGQERKLQDKILRYLHEQKLNGVPLWSEKWSDRVKSGIPDLVGILNSRSWALELKAPGESPTKLQLLTLQEMRDAGGAASWVDSWGGFEDYWGGLTERCL